MASHYNKEELLREIDEGWARLNSTLDMLTPEQWNQPYDKAGWCVKDHVAHITAWEKYVLFFLQGQPASVTFGVEPALLADDIDAVNARLQQQSAALSVGETRAQSHQTHSQLVAALQRLSDEDLSRPNRYYAPLAMGHHDENPVIETITSNTTEHYAEHQPWIENLISK